MISTTHTISPEWQNENALRAYPLEDDAPAAAVLPPWLISDLRISCQPTYVKVYVSSAYVSDTLVSVAISGMTESGTTVGLLARTVTRDELEPHRAYSMDRLSDDASGTIAFGEVPAGVQPFRLTFPARRVAEEVAPGIEVVDYLESTGTQWIDTGVKGQSGIDLDFGFLCTSIGSAQAIGGCWTSLDALYAGLVRANGYFAYHYKNTNSVIIQVQQVSANTYYHVQAHLYDGEQYYALNGIKSAVGAISGDFVSPLNINLFRINASTSTYSNGVRIYYLKIYRNGVLVRDFVPVRFINDLGVREGAMYDSVSGQLFRNQGTGVFGMGDPHVRYEVDAPIVEAAITRVRSPGVTRIVDRAHGTSATGIIDLSGNSEFRTAVDPSDPHTIVFTLTDTYREIATSVCDATPSKDACGDTPVRTINGVAPTTEETEIGGVTYPAGTILLRFR